MQPYFVPYIGYFQLVAAVDIFIIYDNIKYTKKGWINRNRLLRNGQAATFSLPLKQASDHLNVCDRDLAAEFDREKLLNQLKGAYEQAPYYRQTRPLLEQIIRHDDTNLFRFLHHSLIATCEHLGLRSDIRISSAIAIDHTLKNEGKVLALCEAVGASTYVNPIGGTDLYSREAFAERGIDLKFIRSRPLVYDQFDCEFVPWLSIVDLMMFNAPPDLLAMIRGNYDLVDSGP